VEKLVTREELARRLGISVTEIRRREARGQIKRAESSLKKALFKASLVVDLAPFVGKGKMQAIAESKIDYRKMFRYNAEEASKVFQMLKEQKPLEEIVIDLCLHPGTVRAITEEFRDITGAVVVLGRVMEQINDLPLDGNFPLVTGEEILEILTACAASTCEHCHKRPKAICKKCVMAVADAQEE
jgi:hypothetical protein